MSRSLIFGASIINNYEFIYKYLSDKDHIICADGGISHAIKLNIEPDIIVGDFDSMKVENPFSNTKIIRVSKEKDQTDIELAIQEAVKNKITDTLLFGCMDGRFDHTFANIQLLLKYSRKGITIKMINANNIVMVTNKSIVLNKRSDHYISLFALSSKVEKLCLTGMKYMLDKYILETGDAIGVSNEFKEEKAEIKFSSGELLIILSRKEGRE